jgi:hypothetical protein
MRTTILAIALLSTSPVCAAENLKIFDGKAKTVVVNGYSTSFQWPKLLQRKFDRFFDGKRVIEVKSATKGGTPIAKWMDVKTGNPLRPWNQTLKPALEQSENATIVLAQQSLQWAFGDRTAGIEGKDDQKRIKVGADIIQRYAENMLADGADEVFIAMHIYKHGMEPEIGNERFALSELIKKNNPHIHQGPDVWIPTKANYPNAFAGDLQHPNAMGSEIMAQKWFETLLQFDGLEVPGWSKDEMETAKKSEPQQRQSSGTRQPKAIVLRKYDKDGDGKLNVEEREVFEKALKQRQKNRKRQSRNE